MSWLHHTLKQCKRKQQSLQTLIIASTLGAGCLRTTTPCYARAQCDKSQECLAGRCAPKGALPVNADAERRTYLPSAIEVLEGSTLSTPRSITQLDDTIELQLRFPVSLPSKAKVLRASLHLDVTEVTKGGVPQAIQAALLRAKPHRHSPTTRSESWHLAGYVRGETRVHLDVTDLVRHIVRSARGDRGLAIRAVRSEDNLEFAISTVRSGAEAPALDIYWRSP